MDNLFQPGGGSPSDEFVVAGIQPMNRPYLCYIDAAKNLRYGYWTHTGTFSGTVPLAGGGTSNYAPSLAVFQNKQYMAVQSNLDILFKSRTGRQDFDSTSWTPLAGTTDRAPALVVYNNRLYLFIVYNTTAYYRSMDSSGTWTSWQYLVGSNSAYRPALAVFNGKLYYFESDVFTKAIRYLSMNDAGTWSTSHQILTGKTTAGPTPVVYNGSLWVVVRGLAGSKIWYATSMTPDTVSSWSG